MLFALMEFTDTNAIEQMNEPNLNEKRNIRLVEIGREGACADAKLIDRVGLSVEQTMVKIHICSNDK